MGDVLRERARSWLMRVNGWSQKEQLDKSLTHGELDSLTSEFGAVHSAALGERDEAMRALAFHNGRSFCAVCGFDNKVCDAAVAGCLGARARREYQCVRRP